MSDFTSLGIDNEIVDFLKGAGIRHPTPIQERAIPVIQEGKDALLLAPTGSGKTEAALLPLLDRLLRMQRERELFGFFLLYVTPLRALNRDVFKRIEELCEQVGISVAVRHGDTTQYMRRKQSLHPPSLLIITPETLQAIIPGKRLRYHLRTVFAVVVDEIHELADSKRGTQLSMGLERLRRLIDAPFQRVGLSATVGNPNEVAQFLVGTGNQCRTVWAGYEKRRMNLRVESPEPDASHVALSKNLSYPPHSTARLDRIINLISSHQSTLVFVNTRSFAEVLGSKMRALKPAFEFDVHHGSLSKNARLMAEDRLKSGLSSAIIATSSLELGIDIGQADLVIQYSSPREVARALQRTGRSGHSIGGVSEGVVIATVNLDDITEAAVILRRARRNKVERARIPSMTWDVLCHQISGLVLREREMEQHEILELVRAAYPFRETTEEDLDGLLRFMEDRRLLRREKTKVKLGSRTLIYYYGRLSTIPDVMQLTAVDMVTRSPIGVLDEDYVSADLSVGQVFVIRGRPWNVVSIEEEEILCTPASATETDAPRWIGEMIPVPFEVASEVAQVWRYVSEQTQADAENWLKKRYNVTGNALDYIMKTVRNTTESLGVIPTVDNMVIESFGEGLVLHIPLGTKANEALGVVVAALLTTRIGTEVAVERDPYRVLFTSNAQLRPEQIVDILREYSGEQVSAILRMAIKRTQTFASRFVHVARRMDVIRKEAKTKEIPVRRLIKIYDNTPLFEAAMQEVLTEKLEESRVLDLFEQIAQDRISLHFRVTETPSPLARLIVEEKTRFEVMGEITEEDEVLRMMEERLLAKKFRLVCMAEGHWNSVRTLSTLEEVVACPVCGSKRVGAVSPGLVKIPRTVKKRLAGRTITTKEEKQFRKVSLVAELVSRYGRKALVVLAGRGVGPQRASRILRPGLNDRLTMLREIADAEREYARTRPFWDD